MYSRIAIAFAFAFVGTAAMAQVTPGSTATDFGQVLAQQYVDEDVGEAMREALIKFAQSDSSAELQGDQLAEAITAAVRSVYDDRHITVQYSSEPLASSPPAEDPDQVAQFLRRTNFGFKEARILRGNIGYLHIETLADFPAGKVAADAALAFIANSDALILDLRRSQGGSPEMVAYIVSHFVDRPNFLLTRFDFRDGRTREHRMHKIEGPASYGNERPIFVVIGPQTPSASEELAYDLKAFGRATIVGEKSLGAANPGAFVRINDHFSGFVPTGRAVSGITGGNWEGAGVLPDIAIPSPDAGIAAYRLALLKIAEREEPVRGSWLRDLAETESPVLAPHE